MPRWVWHNCPCTPAPVAWWIWSDVEFNRITTFGLRRHRYFVSAERSAWQTLLSILSSIFDNDLNWSACWRWYLSYCTYQYVLNLYSPRWVTFSAAFDATWILILKMNSTITQVRRTLRRKVRHPRGISLKYLNGCRRVLRASFVGSVIEATSRSEYTKVGRNRALHCFCSVVLWVCLTACLGFRRCVLWEKFWLSFYCLTMVLITYK